MGWPIPDPEVETWDQWCKRFFEFEFCEECGGDAVHHQPWIVLGNWFAHCLYPPDEDGNEHPMISIFREEYDRAAKEVK